MRAGPSVSAPPSATSALTRGYAFGEYRVDVAAGSLARGDETLPLPSRAFDALRYLVEHRHRVVPKDELISAIWNDVVVTDDSLVHAISVLRRALADEPQQPKYIQTLPRRGYRFVGDVRVLAAEPAAPAPADAASMPDSRASTLLAVEPQKPMAAPRRLGLRLQRQLRRMARHSAGRTVAAALAAAAMLVAAAFWALPRAPERDSLQQGVRLFQPPPPGASIASGGLLSPDGRALAFVARDETDGTTALWVRALHSAEMKRIDGTDGASKPFWSPDGGRLGFFAGGKLATVEIATGTLHVVTAVSLSPGGGAWAADGTILFADWGSGLYSVHASGGDVNAVAKLDHAAGDIAFAWPQFLPDGRRFLYQIVSLDPARAGVHVGDLDSLGSVRLLETDSPAVFAPPMHLLHVQRDLLIAEEFDARSLEFTGRAMVLARGVSRPALGDDNVVSAAGGLLAFRRGLKEQNLAWVDRSGAVLGTLSMPTVLFNPRVSPDGSRLLATSSVTSEPGLWVASLTGAEFQRLETDAIAPLWAPDGKRVAFTARGGFDLFVRRLGDAGAARPLLTGEAVKILNDWSPDGRHLLYTQLEERTKLDLWQVPVQGAPPTPLLVTPHNEMQARISPDGRWIAYASDETGELEVYVARYPELGERRRVSTAGGGQPQWRADQRELFYIASDRMLIAVPVEGSYPIAFGAPRRLFRAPVGGNPDEARDHYAATADGMKFLIDGAVRSGGDDSITVIMNWAAARNAAPRR